MEFNSFFNSKKLKISCKTFQLAVEFGLHNIFHTICIYDSISISYSEVHSNSTPNRNFESPCQDCTQAVELSHKQVISYPQSLFHMLHSEEMRQTDDGLVKVVQFHACQEEQL